jgi:hypothetical protein
VADPVSLVSRRRFTAVAALVAASMSVEACRRQRSLAGISFQYLRGGRPNRTYLLIHGDEATARQVLRESMVKGARGKAYLVSHPTRNIRLASGGRLDPNRLFSREGAERNLERLNPQWTREQIEQELARLDRERPALIEALLPPPGGLIVALHNNGGSYNVTTEVLISNAYSLADLANPSEFFLTTDPEDFQRLSTLPYNVVLQNEATGEDDGSLSRLMAKRGVRYVNLEVLLGRPERQHEMLRALERVLP